MLYLCDWTLLLTSLSPDKAPPEVVGKLYRGRWQIEIVIKRLKSVLDLGALRARRGSRLAKVYLLGKLLYAMMIERRALNFKQSKDVVWRLWKRIAEQMKVSIAFPERFDPTIAKNVLIVLKERPRKRKPLRVQLLASIKVLHATYSKTVCFSA
jgi:hypothetical protein